MRKISGKEWGYRWAERLTNEGKSESEMTVMIGPIRDDFDCGAETFLFKHYRNQEVKNEVSK